jgi:uncharacterized protein GlcG (DUF336 family)
MKPRWLVGVGSIAVSLSLLAAGIGGAHPSGGKGSPKSLSKKDAAGIFQACQKTAGTTASALRGTGKKTKMWCAVADREGELLLIESSDTNGSPQNPNGSDAWRGSIEIAEAKAYTALAFSSNDQSLDSRMVGLLTRTDPARPPLAISAPTKGWRRYGASVTPTRFAPCGAARAMISPTGVTAES